MEWKSEVDPLDATATLLREVFPGQPKYRNPDYLKWEYRCSPSGPAIEANSEDSVGLNGHFAVIPQRWVMDGESCRFAFSLDTAVSERSRGQGLFSSLGKQVVEEARASGFTALIGLANAQSTPGFVRNIGFEFVRPLPITLIPPVRFGGKHLFEVVEPGDLPSWIENVDILEPADAGVWRVWDAAELSWRLANPFYQYEVLANADLAAVVHRASFLGFPVAVLMKTFARSAAAPSSLLALAAAACARVRAPVAVYGGYNPPLRATGISIPSWLRPSPLNLIVKSLVDDIPASAVVPSCFEFLDFDAY